MRATPVHPLILALALIVPLACADEERGAPAEPSAPVEPEAAAVAAASITADGLLARISLMAADSMRGRDTPSPELDMVADWIAAEFRSFGLRPGVDGGYIQRYPVRVSAVDVGESVVRIGEGTLQLGDDVLPSGGGEGASSGELVLVTGQGPLPTDLTAVDGRHVLLLGDPRVEGRGGAPAALRNAGAAAVWTIDRRDAGVWGQVAARSLLPRTTRVGPSNGPPSGYVVREDAVRRVLSSAGMDAVALLERNEGPVSFETVDLPVEVRVVHTVQSEVGAPNVVGILEGSDPVLRNEYVVYSAHMDHLGVGGPDATGDSIFNGADDNASGTATVMEIARAMAALPRAPRRSMVFLLVSGEEKGLWGSAYFADNPTVPADAMVANVNVDMVGRNWPDTIVAIGKEHSDLGATLERVNAAHPEIGMTAIDDLWPEEGFYRRSDHYNFARKGVPVLFFFNGTHEDYHRPSDEVASIDAEKTARIARLLFYFGLEVSDAEAPPEWNPQSYREIVGGG